jgi:regulation of enolase protein 1 (concanavalin A-like superfamily)
MRITTEAVWTHEPARWKMDGDDRLIVTARGRTDFWRKTRSGFISDNGHMYGTQVRGDFAMRVKVSGHFKDLYDQAGLMIMLNKSVWIKAGIEYVDGTCFLSTVVTRDFSDWAISRPIESDALWLAVERDRDAIIVSASLDGRDYFLVRECTLTHELTLEAGPYLAAPAGDGFTAVFEEFEISQARQPRQP